METLPQSLDIPALYKKYRADLPAQLDLEAVSPDEFQQFFWEINIDDAQYWMGQLEQPDGASQLHEALTLNTKDILEQPGELQPDVLERLTAHVRQRAQEQVGAERQ
jgi:hypothetical protein